jgi:hypothetical protein
VCSFCRKVSARTLFSFSSSSGEYNAKPTTPGITTTVAPDMPVFFANYSRRTQQHVTMEWNRVSHVCMRKGVCQYSKETNALQSSTHTHHAFMLSQRMYPCTYQQATHKRTNAHINHALCAFKPHTRRTQTHAAHTLCT